MNFYKPTPLILALVINPLPVFSVQADAVIQKSYGAFYIVDDVEANKVMNSNNFGLYAIPPSLTLSGNTDQPKKRSTRRKSPVPAVSAPVVNNPVTTVEPAQSIFLRLEKQK